MKKLGLFALLTSALLLSGCTNSASTKSEATTQEEAHIAVTVKKVSTGSISNANTFSGRTVAATETAVTAETMGTIEKVYVSIGDKVEKGTTLLTISAVDANKTVAQAKASLEMAKTSYENALGGSVTSQINQLDNAVKNAELAYNDAKRNYDMYKALYEADGIPEDQFKQIESALAKADQALSSSKKAYETAVSETIPQSQEMAKKSLEQAQVAYDIAASNLNKLTLTAPTSGIITAINFDKGEMISQQAPAFIISNLNSLEINLPVSENDVSKFKPLQTVAVSLKDKNISGTVKDVSKVPDAKTALYTVKISIDNSSNEFLAGLAAEVILTTNESNNTILIPKKAVFEEEGVKYIYLCIDNKAVKTPVETGLINDHTIEITSGITNDSTVVIGGITLIKDGTPIYPVEKED